MQAVIFFLRGVLMENGLLTDNLFVMNSTHADCGL